MTPCLRGFYFLGVELKKEISFYIAAFLVDAGIGVLTVAVPLLAIGMDASPFILGFIGFLSSLFYLSLSILFGRLSDKMGSLPFTAGGCVIFSISSVLFFFSSSFTHIFILMGLIGIGMAMFWTPMEVWIAKVSNNLLKSLGYFSVSWCAGISVGSFISGALFQINPRLPFLFIAILCLAAMFFVYRCPKTLSTPVIQEVKKEENKLKNSFLLIGWVMNFAAWFGIGVIRYLFPKLAVNMGITPFMLGILMFVIGAVQALVSYVMGHTSKWHYGINFLILIQLSLCAGFLILFFSNSTSLFICAFALFGIGVGVAYFSSLYYSLAGGCARGERSGIHEMLVGSGGLAGPLLGGIVAQSFNVRAPFALCAIVMLCAIVLEKNIVRKNEKRM